MGYDENTTAHYRVYIPEMHSTTISSNVKFFEDISGKAIEDYKLWIELSDGTFQESEGTYNQHVTRARKGRPRFADDPPNVDSVRKEQIRQLPASVTGVGEGLALETNKEVYDNDDDYAPGPTSRQPATSPRITRSRAKKTAAEEKRGSPDTAPQKEQGKEPGGAECFTAPTTSGALIPRPEIGGEPSVPRITLDQERQLSRVTAQVIIGVKRKAENELPKASKTSVLPHQNNWNLPETEQERRTSSVHDLGKRYTRTSTFQTTPVTGKRKGLLSVEDEKAMIAILSWFSDDEYMCEADEKAMTAHSAKHDIPIPTTYKEAVEHPIYT